MYLCNPKSKGNNANGSIAQLVQSICLTSRGSAVRSRVLPQKASQLRGFFILCRISFTFCIQSRLIISVRSKINVVVDGGVLPDIPFSSKWAIFSSAQIWAVFIDYQQVCGKFCFPPLPKTAQKLRTTSQKLRTCLVGRQENFSLLPRARSTTKICIALK